MIEKQIDVIVLGAGASGLFCAFTAANRGRKVLVLEKSNKIGKKILMSGGGRCNFSNHFVEAHHFISKNSHFCKSALKRYTQWDFIAMVENYGIEIDERKHSQLFCKNSAKDILSMLLSECEAAGVNIQTHTDVERIKILDSGRFQLFSQQQGQATTYTCESLVVATGALSIPTLGGSGFGYEIAKQFGVKVTALQAGLVPFMFSDHLKPICENLSGLALEVEVGCNGKVFRENILFTHRGMSGPAMLQISNYWNPGDALRINLLPNVNADDWLLEQKRKSPKSLLKTILSNQLSKALVLELLKLWRIELLDTPIAELSDKHLLMVAEKLNDWIVKPSGTEGYRTAEVTMGGVDTDQISSQTMEVKQQKGLFFVGEVLDVTGHLGGFNFQWAWSSGYTAGLFV